jgi:hypothetical protein
MVPKRSPVTLTRKRAEESRRTARSRRFMPSVVWTIMSKLARLGERSTMHPEGRSVNLGGAHDAHGVAFISHMVRRPFMQLDVALPSYGTCPPCRSCALRRRWNSKPRLPMSRPLIFTFVMVRCSPAA